MKTQVPGIRNAVRALIVRDGKVLLQHKRYDDGKERFVLPGGAPNDDETLKEGLIRECEEEIGCRVDVHDLLHVADFHKPRETTPPTYRHQIEFIFQCHVSETYIAQNGSHPDKHQIDVLWVKLSELDTISFFPREMTSVVSARSSTSSCYLGLIN